jgi:hypothetical protein
MQMNDKKTYIWKLAAFLCSQGMVMSGEELADHLNRNNFLTSYGTEYQGGRGTYRLIQQTWAWLNDDLGLTKEAQYVAKAFVKPDGGYAYE